MREAVASHRKCQERSDSIGGKVKFHLRRGRGRLSKKKLTVEEGPNGPVNRTSGGTELEGREGGCTLRVVMTLLGA